MTFDRLAQSLLTTPYVSGQGCLLTGCDCWGLVEIWYAAGFGVALPGRAEGQDSPAFLRQFRRFSKDYISLLQPEDHAICVMASAVKGRRVAGHCGVLWRGHVLHITRENGCRLVPWGDVAIVGRLLGLYRPTPGALERVEAVLVGLEGVA